MRSAPREEGRRRHRGWTPGSIAWKLAALAIAYGMWLGVVEERRYLTQLQIPLRYENLDPALALRGDRPSSIDVQVQAAEGIIEELRPIDVEARIDLTGLGAGSHTFRLWQSTTERDVVPAVRSRRIGVEVVDVFPRQVSFELEAKLKRDVPIVPRITGEPLAGFELGTVQVKPGRVRIEGPASVVEPLTEASTREISVEGARQTIDEEVWIDVTASDVTLSTPVTRVTVPITERVSERQFDALPIVALRGLYEATIRPDRVTVRVRGPERLVAALNPNDVTAYVDIHDLEPRPDGYSLPIEVTFTREPYRQRIDVVELSDDSAEVALRARELAGPPPEPRGG